MENQFGRPRRRREYNTKMNFQDIGWGVYWIDMIWSRERWRAVLKAVLKLLVQQNAGNFVAS